MSEFGNLSSIEEEDCSDESSVGGISVDWSDESSVGGNSFDWSDEDTCSVVSDVDDVTNMKMIFGDDWHLQLPPPDPVGDDRIDVFLQGDETLQKKSSQQWSRFFLSGNRMKTADDTLLKIACTLKWHIWCTSGNDYMLYIAYITRLMVYMDSVGLLSTAYHNLF
jgi:hypothetical protein